MATMMKTKKKEKKKKARDKVLAEVPFDTINEFSTSHTEVACVNKSVLELEEEQEHNEQSSTALPEVEASIENVNELDTFQSEVELTSKIDDKCAEEVLSPLSEIANLDMNEAESSCNLSNMSILNTTQDDISEDVQPSAPQMLDVPRSSDQLLEESPQTCVNLQETPALSLDEAIRIFGGKEIMEIRAMSEQEQSIVLQDVALSEHPLADLLHTFRLCLRSMERARSALAQGFAEERSARAALWAVERRSVTAGATCACGERVSVRVSYEHARFLQDKLPLAQMKLEGVLRDVHDTYCREQFTAIITHYQIDDVVAAAVKYGNPEYLRTALSLVLRELRLAGADTGAGGGVRAAGGGARAAGGGASGAVLPAALRRWAAALASALLRSQGHRALLFIIHHLFRQVRSVRWAAEAMQGAVEGARDVAGAARLVALLQEFLLGGVLDGAQECTEESIGEGWEEVSARGAWGVREGALRERDARAVLRALPLPALAACLALGGAGWGAGGDGAGGRGVARAALGVRAALLVLGAAARHHAAYPRLRRDLLRLAITLVENLADLDEHCSAGYAADVSERVRAELCACARALTAVWAAAGAGAGAGAAGGALCPALPLRLLAARHARAAALALTTGLHGEPAGAGAEEGAEALGCAVSALSCAQRAALAGRLGAARRETDLAAHVLRFLVQCGLSSNRSCECAALSRESLPGLLAAHPDLYPVAFKLLDDLPDESLAAGVRGVCAAAWRPRGVALAGTLRGARPALRRALLPALHLGPGGVSAECELALAEWLRGEGEVAERAGAAPAEELWAAARRLAPRGAVPPCPRPPAAAAAPGPARLADLLDVVGTEWGACVPLACSCGVACAERLARAGRGGDAAAALARLLHACRAAPDAISHTPQFGEVVRLVCGGGGGVLRALARRPGDSAALLRHMRRQLHEAHGRTGEESPQTLAECWARAAWSALCGGGGAEGGAGGGAELLQAAALAEPQAVAAVAYWFIQERSPAAALEAATAAVSAPDAALAALSLVVAHHDAAHQQCGGCARLEAATRAAAAAALAAPPPCPAHLALWALFFQLYLRPLGEDLTPFGYKLFTSIFKWRMFSQMTSKLQSAVKYHKDECERLRAAKAEAAGPARAKVEASAGAEAGAGAGSDIDFLPELRLGDLCGDEAADCELSGSDTDLSSEDEAPPRPSEEPLDAQHDISHLLEYHSERAELAAQCAARLAEGAAARRGLPVLSAHSHPGVRAVIREELSRLWGSEAEEEPPTPAAAAAAAATPLERVRDRLLRMERKHQRFSRRGRAAPAELGAARLSLRADLLDRHLADLDVFAQQWGREWSRCRAAAAALWSLERARREPAAAPPAAAQCSRRCAHTTVPLQFEEWRISTRTERAIEENRAQSGRALRALCEARRARPAAAAVAALRAAAPLVSSGEAARGLAERARARPALACALLRDALEPHLCDMLQRLVSGDAALCVPLAARWAAAEGAGGGAEGGAEGGADGLLAALVSPGRLGARWPDLYAALLPPSSRLPPHTLFVLLSKFDMRSLCASEANEASGAGERALTAALGALQYYATQTSTEHTVVIELLCMQAEAWCGAAAAARLSAAAAALCRRARPPRARLAPLPAALARRAARPDLTVMQLSACIESQSVWAEETDEEVLTEWAQHVPPALDAMLAALLCRYQDISENDYHAAEALWRLAGRSWRVWVLPARAPGLLALFIRQLHCILAHCAGAEGYILQEVFLWALSLRPPSVGAGAGGRRGAGAGAGAGGDWAAQYEALLDALADLPWDQHQWLDITRSLHSLLQTAQWGSAGGAAARRWAGRAARALGGRLWWRPHCAQDVLLLLCDLPFQPETVKRASGEGGEWSEWGEWGEWREAWRALRRGPGLPALLAALTQRPSLTPHTLRLMLRACGVGAGVGGGEGGRGEAGDGAARRWAVRATLAGARGRGEGTPPLLRTLLLQIEELARAEVEEAAGLFLEALPGPSGAGGAGGVGGAGGDEVAEAWHVWGGGAAAGAVPPALGALAHLPDAPAFTLLAETLLTTFMTTTELGWEALERARGEWAGGLACGRDVRALGAGGAGGAGGARGAGGAPHAAYLLALAAPHCAAVFAPPPDFDFVEHEVIAATWVCHSCVWLCRRLEEEGATAGAGEVEGEGEVSRGEVEQWLQRCARDYSRSLLRTVTLRGDNDQPTDKLRLLSRVALCVAGAGGAAGAERAIAAAAALGEAGRGAAGAGRGDARAVARLAQQLWPRHRHYFQLELRAAETLAARHHTN